MQFWRYSTENVEKCKILKQIKIFSIIILRIFSLGLYGTVLLFCREYPFILAHINYAKRGEALFASAVLIRRR